MKFLIGLFYKLAFLFFMSAIFYIPANGQTIIPVYEDLSLPKPKGISYFNGSDFKVDIVRLGLYPDDFLYGNRQVLDKLFSFLQKDTEGIQIWEKAVTKTAGILNRWDLDEANFNRYVYRIPQLQDLALVYMFSGHKELGQFIRGHILQMTELPYEFWLHAELRGFDPSFPQGMLETAAICNVFTVSLSAAGDLFSETETAIITNALKEKGLIPCVNWLTRQTKTVNNFVAVIGSAAYHTAKYFGEKESEELALNRLVYFIDSSIETDGSFGEGFGYFDYPIGATFLALLAMEPEERSKYIASSPLKHSASWKAYPLLMPAKGKNKNLSLHFGDNSYNNPMNPTVGLILGGICQNPVAVWLMNRSGDSYGLQHMLLVFSEGFALPEPKSPEQAGLPLVKSFKGGDSYIRSTWEKDGIVLGMWSGDGSLIKYSHQRPEHGSICMGAYGEYMIVSSGSASYRSDLHYQWDFATKSTNTITIDDKNQLFPGNGTGRWNKTDVSGFWVSGSPKSEILQCESGEIADLLVNEMSTAYHVPMKFLRRSILFVKNPGYFIVIDKIEAKEDAHKYSWRIHLNNRDEQGKLESKSPNRWLFSRPFANLNIHLFSDREIAIEEEKGYMHGPSRDYSPAGRNEGILGSSIGLVAYNIQKTQSMIYYSVLFPTKKGVDTPKISYKKNRIFVGDDVIKFKDGECLVSQKKKTEKFKLWE